MRALVTVHRDSRNSSESRWGRFGWGDGLPLQPHRVQSRLKAGEPLRALRSILTILFLLVSALSAYAQATVPTVEEVIERVQKVYSRHCCFQASFNQLTVNVAMDMKDRFQGTMYVKSPDNIALEVDAPEKQRVVVRGRSYTVFFPDDGNAVQGEVPPEVNVERFFGFLANVRELDRNFLVAFPSKVEDPAENLLFLELTDRQNPKGTYRIVVAIDATNFTVRRTIIYDALGNYNRFDLSNITFVQHLPESRFTIPITAKDAKGIPHAP